MKPFNRERFLFYLLGAVLFVNALFFGYGVVMCSRADDPVGLQTAQDIGQRFDNYSVKRRWLLCLGLTAGAVASR